MRRATVDWAKETPRYRALALEQMEKIGLHDVEQRIRTEKIVTPTGWAERVRSVQGRDVLAWRTRSSQMLHLRPHNRFEDVGQMYLVGGGTHPGSGLPVIFESARITSRLLLEDLQMEPQWETTGTSGLERNELVGVASVAVDAVPDVDATLRPGEERAGIPGGLDASRTLDSEWARRM